MEPQPSDWFLLHAASGIAAWNAQEYSVAAAGFQKLLSRYPYDPEIHFYFGLTLVELGRLQAARLHLNEAIRNLVALYPSHSRYDQIEQQAQDALNRLPPLLAPRPHFHKAQTVFAPRSQNQYTVSDHRMGSYGVVYEVNDAQGQRYALKTFRTELAGELRERGSEQEIQRLFEREAAAWILLPLHPHLVQAYWIERFDNVPAVIAEFCRQSLADRLLRSPLLLKDALKLGLQLCAGMTALERDGLVHGDLKPANCMISVDGDLKIADFGMMRMTDVSFRVLLDDARMSPNVQGGTTDYAAPEQWDPSVQIDCRADIYSFGIVLFEMLMGRRPRKQTQGTMERLVLTEAVLNWEEMRRRLNALIAHCVRRNRDERPRSFAEVSAVLSEIAALAFVSTEFLPPPAVAPDAVMLYNRGMSLMALEMYGGAVRCFQQAQQQRSDSALRVKLLNGLGMAFLRSHQGEQKGSALLTKAEAALREALNLAPEDDSTLNNFGRLLLETGRCAEAERCFRRTLTNPSHETLSNPILYTNLAECLQLQNKRGEALAVCDRGLARFPKYAGLFERKGIVLLDLKEYSQARACFQAALEIDPKASNLWKGMGVIHSAQQNHSEAITAFSRAIDFLDGAKHEADVWAMKGDALQSLAIYKDPHGATEAFKQEMAEAAQCLKTAVKIAPEDVSFRKLLATILLQSNHWQEARDLFLELSSQFPHDIEIILNVAVAYYSLDDPESALHWADKGMGFAANQNSPLYGTFSYYRGLCLKDLNRLGEARQALRRGREHATTSEAMREHLDRLDQEIEALIRQRPNA